MTKPQNIKVSKNLILFPCVKHFIIVKTIIKFILKAIKLYIKVYTITFLYTKIFSVKIYLLFNISLTIHCTLKDCE